MATHFSILAWKIHGQRGHGQSLWGRKEWDMTEHTQEGRQDIGGKNLISYVREPQ